MCCETPAQTRLLIDASHCRRLSGYAEAVVTVDNFTSKAHTVLSVRTRDRKGLFYDSMRATKGNSVCRLTIEGNVLTKPADRSQG